VIIKYPLHNIESTFLDWEFSCFWPQISLIDAEEYRRGERKGTKKDWPQRKRGQKTDDRGQKGTRGNGKILNSNF